MKKNYTVVFAVIVALLVLCVFWGCSSSDDDDDGPSLPHAEEAGLGNTEITLATGVQVYNKADGTPYTPGVEYLVRPRDRQQLGNSYCAAVEAVSKVTSDGKLTLKLPVYNTYWSEHKFNGTTFWDGLDITANPPNTKIAYVDNFFIILSSSNSLMLQNNNVNGESKATYMYADRDAIVTASFEGEGDDGEPITIYVNAILKQGWNSVIESVSGSTWTIVSGNHGAGYRWERPDDD
jgi:hypothetical protein